MKIRDGAALLIALTCVLPTQAVAQNSIKSSLTLSSITITFPTATEANYDAGFVAATAPLTLTFDAKKNAGGQPSAFRTSTISVHATSNLLGGTKPISDLQWKRTTDPTWTSMSMADATIESRVFFFNAQNDPWSTVVQFQTLLGWTNTPPATYSATIVFTLTVTTP